MRIVLTGGGSGGHFYPMIAVAQQIRVLAKEDKLIEPDLIYMATEEYDPDALFENNISFKHINAGKRRRYTSILNFFDLFKTGLGVIKAMLKLFFVFPDVVFSKGGYASVPVVLAARVFGIPVIIHESDAVPGKANVWAAKYARRIAVSYPESAEIFRALVAKKKKAPEIAVTGNPVRHEMQTLSPAGAHEFLKLSHDIPTVLVLGGSQGATTINETLIETLPELVTRYQIIHQTGKANFEITKRSAEMILENNPNASRYVPFPFLNVVAMRMAAGAADLIISRAGSGAIFEIALWGKPSILIPIPEDVSHDQKHNAFAYARTGASVVVAQENLTPHLLTSEITRLMDSQDEREKMSREAKAFSQPDAARKIAREVLDVALEHEE
ncbi:MAG: UDP-N-acetylglucosamine--N-acetylmuramyl-(pentapeptide) pyrophosphoryl-undecaprenol N-acetylglucosamine transferase [Candidatus Campbellbacteria bacterium]